MSTVLLAASFMPVGAGAEAWNDLPADHARALPGGDSPLHLVADDPVDDDAVELSEGGAQCDPYACWLAEQPWAFTVSTSAYAWGCGASGPTRTGTPVRWGVVAVDPRVIPLGTHLEIEGFMGTTFIAEDTGGGVVGHKVDIYWPAGCADARRYGRQPRAVRFVG